MLLEIGAAIGVIALLSWLGGESSESSGSRSSSSSERLVNIRDADGRTYRFRFVRDSHGAWHVYALSIPWNRSRWQRYSDHDIHLFKSRMEVCLSKEPIRDYDTAYQRTKLWANAFSFMMENGLEATRRLVKGW